MNKKIVIGSRDSKLAVAQAEIVRQAIRRAQPQLETEIRTMKTTGDKILDRPLDEIGGKGLFVKELDKALQNGDTDISVHSLKDMPMELPGTLPLVAFSEREDARDVLVLPQGVSEIDFDKPIGCSGKRRILQAGALYPQATFKSVRGNVLTRLHKLDDGQYGALILAAAGLKRLGLEHRISRYFETEEILPAAGQAILAVQGRDGEDYTYLSAFNDAQARDAALCERAFVRALDGGCSSPVAAYAKICDEKIFLRGLYYNETDDAYLKGSLWGRRCEPEQLGYDLAQQLRREYEGLM